MLSSLIIFCLVGIFAGTLAGLLGVGGGLVVVPALAWYFTVNKIMPASIIMHIVAGTSLAAMISTTLFSLRAHHHRGAKIWPIFKLLAPGISVGTLFGTLLARFLHSGALKMIFGLFVLLVAFHMFFSEKTRERVRQLPGQLSRWTSALLIGVSSGLLGIGGSTLSIPYLIYYDVPIREAMGVATACGLMVAVTGTIAFIVTGWHQIGLPAWSTGYVYWPAAFAITLLSPWFTTLGATLSHRLPINILRRIFAIFLLLVGIEMLVG